MNLLTAFTTGDARAIIAPLVPESIVEDDARVASAYARAVWSSLVEPGDGAAGAFVAAFGPVCALTLAGDQSDAVAVAERTGLSPQEVARARARWRPRLGASGPTIDAAVRAGISLLIPEDERWPARLDDLGVHAPLCLWVRGEPGALSSREGAPRPAVSIVGARAATAYGEHVAGEMSADLAGSGVAVVSGAAYGIDGIAHRAALSAGGQTVALLAGGVDAPYPRGHTDLLTRISTAAAVASEVPCGGAPTKFRFLARNRLIAALGDATVVVEAGWRSGSLNTAGHASTLGRPLGAVPGPITSAASAGCHRLLREYDAACITGADDIRELIGLDSGVPALTGALSDESTAERSGERTDERTRILDALSTRVDRETDEIARRSGFAVDDTRALLGLLRLEGVVAGGAAGWKRVR